MCAGTAEKDTLLSEVEVRRALAMLTHQEEWKCSLAESHRDDVSREALLSDFAGKTIIMRQALTAWGVGALDEVQQAVADNHQQSTRSAWF